MGEKEKGKEGVGGDKEEGGPVVHEEEGVVVIDYSGKEGEDESEGGEGEGEEEEGEDEGDEGKDKEGGNGRKDGVGDNGEGSKDVQKAPSIKDVIREAKEELSREGGKGQEGKKGEEGRKSYTLEELDAAEDKLAELLNLYIQGEEGGINPTTYQQYMRNIRNIRGGMEKEQLVMDIEKGRRKQGAEEMVTGWAKQNAPEYLDGRTKEYREAVEWAETTLGAEKRGDVYMLPAKVAAIAFGVLHKGQVSGKEEGEKAAKGEQKSERQKGYEEGVREKVARGKELGSRDTKPPKSGGGAKDAPATDKERRMMEMLGLPKERLATYRKLKGMGTGRSVMEVK